MAVGSTVSEQQMLTEEKKAKAENTRVEANRLAQARKRKPKMISLRMRRPKKPRSSTNCSGRAKSLVIF